VAAAAAEVVKGRVAAGSARAELTGLAAGNRLAIGSGATAEAPRAAPVAVVIRSKTAVEAASAGLAAEMLRPEAPGARLAADVTEFGDVGEAAEACLPGRAGPVAGAFGDELAAGAFGDGSAGEVAGTEATAEAVGAGMAETGLADHAFEAGAERLARPAELGGAPGNGRSSGGPDGKPAGGYRSRLQRGDPIPGRAPRDGVSAGGVSLPSAFLDTAVRDGAFREGALPRIAMSGGRSRREAYPDVVLPKADLPLVTLTSPRRREARRQPRHAAPSVGLGSRIAGFGSRMTGLFATRALASGARG
jgi:hypothetical protein